MSDIQVTRRDREMALDAASPSWRSVPVSFEEQREIDTWLDAGEMQLDEGDEDLARLVRDASAIAQARAEGAASERENAVLICENEAWWCEYHAKNSKGAARKHHAGIAMVMREAAGRIRRGERSGGDRGDKSMMANALDEARAEGFAAGKAAALEVAREVSCRLLFLNDAEDLVDAVTEELAQKEPDHV